MGVFAGTASRCVACQRDAQVPSAAARERAAAGMIAGHRAADVADRRLVVLDDRAAVRALVARCSEGVGAQRIGVRRSALLVERRAQDAGFSRLEVGATGGGQSGSLGVP
jgi:hypothetical protein